MLPLALTVLTAILACGPPSAMAPPAPTAEPGGPPHPPPPGGPPHPPPPGRTGGPPTGGPPSPGSGPPSPGSGPPTASSAPGTGNLPFAPVATDLTHWRGSPVTMVGQAAAQDAERVTFAQSIGATMDISVMPSTFALTWVPPEGAQGVIVTLHGHSAFAYDELYLWYPYAKERHLAIVAVQWWDTLFESEADYLPASYVYTVVTDSLKKHFGTAPPPVVLHGFSRGSAQIFGVAACDAASASPVVKGVIANSGGVEAEYPATLAVEKGTYGQTPYAGQKWVLACGGNDPQPDRSGCPAMERTQPWLEKYGADVVILEDAQAGHGGFQKNTRLVAQALDRLLAP